MFQKAAQGTTNHLAGLAAEHSVISENAGRAHQVLAHRWRDDLGEIDLIFADCDGLIFTEVKKSHSHDAALRSLGGWQQNASMKPPRNTLQIPAAHWQHRCALMWPWLMGRAIFK